jgi:hypothetical protein
MRIGVDVNPNPRNPKKPNKPESTNWIEKLQNVLLEMQFLSEAGVNPSPYLTSLIAEGYGFELAQSIKSHLWQQAVLNSVTPPQAPSVDQDQDVLYLGDVPIPLNRLGQNMLLTGAVGTGKTNGILNVIKQALGRVETIKFWDFKGEARRLPLIFPEAKVFTPRNAPWQFFQVPHGVNPMDFGVGVITAIRIGTELRAETFPVLYSIWERIVRGRRSDDPWPSVHDFRLVVHDEAEATHRENLFSVERMLLAIEVLLGPNARVRYVPKEQSNALEGYDLVGQDPKIFRLFIGLHVNELLFMAQAEEHTTKLRAIEVIDEIAPLASVDVTRTLYGDLNGLQQAVTLLRFTGTGLIMGAQNISRIDPLIKNVATLVVFRPPSYEDAIDAARMLALKPDAAQKLMGLSVGQAYVKSVGWAQPVLVQFPEI